jgi:hypothetical protein
MPPTGTSVSKTAYNEELLEKLSSYVQTTDCDVAPVATSSPLAGVLRCLGYTVQGSTFADSKVFVDKFVGRKGLDLLDLRIPADLPKDVTTWPRLVDAASASLLQVAAAHCPGFDFHDLLEGWTAANRVPSRRCNTSSRVTLYNIVLVCVIKLFAAT